MGHYIHVVFSGQVSNGVVVSGSDIYNEIYMHVSSGGMANSTTVCSHGYVCVSAGGVVNEIVVNSRGYLYVSSGAFATAIRENGGYVEIADEANATFVSNVIDNLNVYFNCSATLHSGTTANSAIVNQYGNLFILSGGIADNTLVYSLGIAYILSGGTANFTAVNSGGWIYVDQGGVANSTVVNNCGSMYVLHNGSANATILNGGSMYIASDGVTNETTVNNGGYMYVSSGGVANETTVNNRGYLCVSSGGVASKTTVNNGGSMYILSGGTALDVHVNTGGCIGISVVPDTYIRGTRNDSTFEMKNASVTGISLFAGDCLWLESNGVAYLTAVNSYGRMYIYSGGEADSTTVLGSMCISSGGVANGTIVNRDGYLYVFSGGVANETTVSNGHVYISSGGEVNATTVNGWGGVYVFDGGIANSTVNNGIMYVSSGGVVSSTVNNGWLFVSNGGVADKTTIARGNLSVAVDGKANSTIVDSGGTLGISPGGVANATTVNSGGAVYFTGEVNSATVNCGGSLNINSGGKLTGMLNFADGAIVSAHEGSIIDFDISELLPGAPARINNLSLIQGVPNYTITVSATQTAGVYKLAGGAAEFGSMITIKTDIGTKLGTLTIGGRLISDNDSYRLVRSFDTLLIAVNFDDTIPPVKPILFADFTAPTNRNVTVTAIFSEDSFEKQYSLDGENWQNYSTGVVMADNGTVYFRGIDEAGNVSDVTSYTVSNIDKVAPVITLTGDNISAVHQTTLSASADDGSTLYYRIDGTQWLEYTAPLTVNTNATYEFKATDMAGNTGTALLAFANILPVVPEDLVGSKNGLSWTATGAAQYVVEYSTDDFEHVISVVASSNGIDSLELPSGMYSWRVRAAGNDEWKQGESIVSDNADTVPKVISPTANGNGDVFFANASGTWTAGYAAKHVGSIGDWNGTEESVSAIGKNRFHNLFFGSTDANILLLTDDANGDAIFVDDIYTELPGTVSQQQSRIARIWEIRAGAGDDIVDMTSQRFEYIGDGLTIRGGSGNDTLWANKGDNMLFGDAGDDHLVGASGNDVLVGGIGYDSMHGGGGTDIFAFCENWGNDTVEQLADGAVTLWFASGSSDNWNASTLTYTDGSNSVTVTGTDNVTLKFGDDGSGLYTTLSDAGAFAEFTSENIFEERGKGILASL